MLLLLDRILGTSFFMPTLVEMGQLTKYGGGSPILFQHLFSGSSAIPEVYIVALPAFGIISDLISRPRPEEHLRLSHDGLGDRGKSALSVSSCGAHHMYGERHATRIFGFFFRHHHAHHRHPRTRHQGLQLGC